MMLVLVAGLIVGFIAGAAVMMLADDYWHGM